MNNSLDQDQKQMNESLRATVVKNVHITRHAVKKNGPDAVEKVVLSTDGEAAFIEKGVSSWSLDLASEEVISPQKSLPPVVSVEADWHTVQEALEKGIRVLHGNTANSFGRLGALLVPDGFNIPTIAANIENVKYYGLQLIKNNATFSISSEHFPIAMMKYHYTRDYKSEFLIQEHGGGGVFVETHDFPHIHIPLMPECSGHIIIGKKISRNEYHFTAFSIPYGYALYTPSNTIHGDGTLIGQYALTVADPAMASADSVLFYNRNSLKMAQAVIIPEQEL